MKAKREVRELNIERYLKRRVEEHGGVCRKWVCPGRKGVPDRICIFRRGLIIFVECKRPNEKPSTLQGLELKLLTDLGCFATYVSSGAAVDELIKMVQDLQRQQRMLKPQ